MTTLTFGWYIESRAVLQKKNKKNNVCNTNDFVAQTVSGVRVFNVSAILIRDTLQTTSPFADAVIDETLRLCSLI